MLHRYQYVVLPNHSTNGYEFLNSTNVLFRVGRLIGSEIQFTEDDAGNEDMICLR